MFNKPFNDVKEELVRGLTAPGGHGDSTEKPVTLSDFFFIPKHLIKTKNKNCTDSTATGLTIY